MTQKRLAGKNAVITGGAGGIAVATAISFADEGANVVVVDIDQVGVEKNRQYHSSRYNPDGSGG
jgi:NAD(P)-dependent dehydrogenase (short-subunit alcohol dehydrogenase family)